MSNIFIISGPSGSGQDSVIEGLRKILPIERVITTTTRPMRPGESQKNPYYFIGKTEFKKAIKENKFFEHAEEYNGHYYGVARREINRAKRSKKINIWKMEYKGVITAKKLIPGITAILIYAPLKNLEKRIRQRGKNVSEKFIKERMDYTKQFLKHKNIYDYKVINKEGELNKAVNDVAKIIKKKLKLRPGRLDKS
ncbi:guanylate kinase [Patescibacteria group bacterium]|nr:guanylate kinase [Patescibacteria group bacterium]MBU4347789.1 guanylate kinase [Patescibacteria group bacterium]MBU4455011.1 guanylate kinase [Patescibacteria group bacterium]MCG2690969.1 guanylate kinase [Candidatus Parcubacteria bacterium]